jgi:hypothetical protein
MINWNTMSIIDVISPSATFASNLGFNAIVMLPSKRQ